MYPIQQIVQTELLHPNPWNSNIVSPDNQSKIDASIVKFGFFKPVVVRERSDGELEIVGGEHRWEGARRLNIEEIPVFNLGPISDKEAKEISIADNARYGVDDSFALAAILSDIGTPEELQMFLPMSDEELGSLFSASHIALEDIGDEEIDDSSEDPSPAVTKLAKTHAIIRFKVTTTDAERISDLITRVKTREGFTGSDDLTNAGDALAHLLLAGGASE